MRRPYRASRADQPRLWLVLGCAAALLLSTGCGGSAASSQARPLATTVSRPAAPASIEQLAEQTGCRPQIRTDADELRQGICQTPSGKYVVTTFVTDKGQRDWLDYAQMYGGSHLMGTRWVISGGPELLSGLRGMVGGVIRSGRKPH